MLFFAVVQDVEIGATQPTHCAVLFCDDNIHEDKVAVGANYAVGRGRRAGRHGLLKSSESSARRCDDE